MITKLTKHDNHRVSIHKCKPTAFHYAALRCEQCNEHIQWLNRQEAHKIIDLGVAMRRPLIKPEELGI